MQGGSEGVCGNDCLSLYETGIRDCPPMHLPCALVAIFDEKSACMAVWSE
jgi:hypothetical protein